MDSYNTIQAAWARSRPKQTPIEPHLVPMMEACFYAGAAACYRLALDASKLSQQAFSGVMQSLGEEIGGYCDAHASLAAQRIDMETRTGETVTHFSIPLIGNGADAARRAALAIELGKEAAQSAECPALLPYLIEALQHVLIGGTDEDTLRADIAENWDWWHEKLHDGTSPKAAARQALALPPEPETEGVRPC